MSENEETYFWGRLPRHIYYSRRISSIFDRAVSPRRFVQRVIEGKGGIVAVKQGKEIILRKWRVRATS